MTKAYMLEQNLTLPFLWQKCFATFCMWTMLKDFILVSGLTCRSKGRNSRKLGKYTEGDYSILFIILIHEIKYH